jgi:hypothetical protein
MLFHTTNLDFSAANSNSTSEEGPSEPNFSA